MRRSLVYASLSGSFAVVSRAVAEGSHRNAAQFVELARLLNHPGIQGYTELLEEQAAEFRKTQTGFVINIVGNAIVSLVAIWKIVNVVA